jgi:hypothetical protein
MDSIGEEFGKRCIHRPLTLDTIHAGKSGGYDFHGEMAFAARIMTGVAAMQFAVVTNDEMCRFEGYHEPAGDFFGDLTG